MSKLIQLTQGKSAIVDDGDFEMLSRHKWHVSRQPNDRFYVVRGIFRRQYGTKTIRMHRTIMDAKQGQIIDHVNRNGLDNRRCNLRLCSNSENLRNSKKRITSKNTSFFKGIHWRRDIEKWQARICLDRNKGQSFLGHFDDEIEAALAYDAAARQHFGEFARTNFGSENVEQSHNHI